MNNFKKVLYLIVVTLIILNITTIEAKPIETDIYTTFCTKRNPYLKSIFKFKTVLKKNNEVLLKDDFECSFTNNLLESKDYLYLDSGSKISRINKIDDSIKEFPIKAVPEESLNFQVHVNGKGYIKQTDTYFSLFNVNPNLNIVKILTGDNYSEFEIEASHISATISDSGDIILTEFNLFEDSTSISSLSFDGENYTNYKKILTLNDGYDSSFSGASNFFKIDDKYVMSGFKLNEDLSTTYSIDSFDENGKLIKNLASQNFDLRYIYTTKYSTAKIINNKIISSVILNDEDANDSKVAVLIFDLETNKLDVRQSEYLNKYINKSVRNDLIDVQYVEDKIYIGFLKSKNNVGIYEMNSDGTLNTESYTKIKSHGNLKFHDFWITQNYE